MTEYIMIKRRNPKSIPMTMFPKGSQMPKELVFMVQTKFLDRFPKRGFSMVCFYVADFIFADGKLVKNRFGST